MEYVVNLERVREDPEGTRVVALFQGKNISDFIMRHCIRTATIVIHDGRTITPLQRRKAYAMERDIADYCGYIATEERQYVHNELKVEFCRVYELDGFSLSNCRMDIARDYINFLIDYALRNGVPLSEWVMERSDDIDATLIACIRRRKCCLCGREGEIHHVDAVGMGNDRKHYDDSYNRIMCLCREHHTEFHRIGREDFCEKYKVYGIEKYRTEVQRC